MSERVLEADLLSLIQRAEERARLSNSDIEVKIHAALLELRTLREENEKMREALRTAITALVEATESWEREQISTYFNAMQLAAPFAGEEAGNG